MNDKENDKNSSFLEMSNKEENNEFGMNDLQNFKSKEDSGKKVSSKKALNKSFTRQFTRKNTKVGISYEAIENLSKKDFLDIVEGKSSITNAEEHLLACRIYDYEKLKTNSTENCDDCLVPIPKNDKDCQLSMCFDSKSLIPYGMGFYMYFFYLKFIIIVNLIAILIVAIPQIYYCYVAKKNLENICLTNQINITSLLNSNTNITITNSIRNYYYNTFNLTSENQIEKIVNDIPPNYPYCKVFVNITNQFKNSFLWQMSYEAIHTQDIFTINTYKNIEETNLNIDLNLLNFIAEVVIIIVNFLLIVSAFNISISLENSNITPKDYALILNNVPSFYTNEDIKKEIKVDEVEIHEIIRTYKLEEFNLVKDKYLEYKSNMIDLYNYGNRCCGKTLTIKENTERMKIIDEFMSKYMMIVNNIEEIDSITSGEIKNENEINEVKEKDKSMSIIAGINKIAKDYDNFNDKKNDDNNNNNDKIDSESDKQNNDELNSDNNMIRNKKESIDTGINFDLDNSEILDNHINALSKKELSNYNKLVIMLKKQNTKSDTVFDFFNQKEKLLEEIGVSNFKIKIPSDILNSTCFLIFNNTKDANKFHDYFPNSTLAYLFYLIMLFLSNTVLYCFFSVEKRKKYRDKVKYICTGTEEPSDIIWENLQYTPLNRLLRTILIYMFSVCILSGSAVALFYISKLQISYNDKLTINQRYLISILFSFCIYIFNQIIIYILSLLTYFEKHESFSHLYLSYSYKLLLIGFVNDAIIPVIVFYFSNDWENKGKYKFNLRNIDF